MLKSCEISLFCREHSSVIVATLWARRPELGSRQGRNFFPHRLQIGSGFHATSYQMGTEDFPRV